MRRRTSENLSPGAQLCYKIRLLQHCAAVIGPCIGGERSLTPSMSCDLGGDASWTEHMTDCPVICSEDPLQDEAGLHAICSFCLTGSGGDPLLLHAI